MTGCVMGAIAPSSLVDPLTVTASNVSGGEGGPAPGGNVSTANLPNTVPLGGTPPYTFQWTQTGGVATGGPFSVSGPTLQNPTWSDFRNDGAADDSENWQVEVTDDEGRTATDTISVTLTWTQII